METKKCPRCGKELPIENFYIMKDGRVYAYCKQCSCELKKKYQTEKKERRQREIANNDLKNITSRELILELRRRGYRGELIYEQKVKI